MEHRETVSTLSPRLEAICRAYSQEAKSPTGGDKIIAAYAEAAEQEIHHEFGQLLETAFEFRDTHKDHIDAHHAVQLILRVLQWQMLKHYPHIYPQNFTQSEVWSEKINELINDPDSSDMIENALAVREVQSNVVERYKAIKLIGHMYRDRIGEEPELLDVGCSLDLGLKKLSAKKGYSFGEIQAGTLEGGKLVSDKKMTRAANALLASKFAIGASMGVDIEFSQGKDMMEWIRACSFYPSELLKPALLMEFNDLQNEGEGQIGFYGGDFTRAKAMENLHIHYSQQKWEMEHPGYKNSHESLMELIERMHGPHPDEEIFDMVLFITSMYLMKWHERIRAFKRAKKLVKPTGLIVVQDFAERRPSGNTKLRFHNDFQYGRMPYRTYIIDPKLSEIDPQHIFSWETGRCQKMQLGLGKIAVRGRMRTPSQLLKSRL